MQYIVIDLEWNQPLGPSLMVEEPVRLNGDIIEIGAVRLNDDYSAGDVYRGYVRPQYYTKMNRKVGNLTHIDPKLLLKAPEFAEAWKLFQEWCGEDVCFLVWGTSDMTMLRENLRVRGLPCGLPPCCDLQEVFEDQITRDGRQWSLTDAMKAMNMPMLTAHDASNDAVNTAALCVHLDMDDLDYFTDYVPRVKDEHTIPEGGDDAFIREFPCPACGQSVHIEEPLPPDPEAGEEEEDDEPGFRAHCPDCGKLIVRLKSSMLPGKKRRVVRTIYAAAPEPDDE